MEHGNAYPRSPEKGTALTLCGTDASAFWRARRVARTRTSAAAILEALLGNPPGSVAIHPTLLISSRLGATRQPVSANDYK